MIQIDVIIVKERIGVYMSFRNLFMLPDKKELTSSPRQTTSPARSWTLKIRAIPPSLSCAYVTDAKGHAGFLVGP